MSSTAGKIGGEYGPVRTSIDLEKLESYLEANVEAIRTPVDVKQFKVRSGLSSR